MNDPEQLLERYKAAHRVSGDVDPRPFLEQVSGVERTELAAHIDHYLATAAARPFDPEAFARFRRDSRREALVSRILDDTTLEDLVKASGIRRMELGRRLAQRLGLPGRDAKVRGRLRDIENGDVDLERVRPTLWEALAAVLGESADRVRRAAENAAGGPDRGLAGLSFARSGEMNTALRRDPSREPLSEDEDQRLVDEAFFLD